MKIEHPECIPTYHMLIIPGTQEFEFLPGHGGLPYKLDDPNHKEDWPDYVRQLIASEQFTQWELVRRGAVHEEDEQFARVIASEWLEWGRFR